MARAIVTLAVGERCYRPWHDHLLPGWQCWCDRHGYQLVVFDHLLDTSAVAQNRSPAWQKLLAMAAPELRPFEQALWIDADVMLCPWAPDPLEECDPNLVGMARDDGSPLASEPLWFRDTWAQILKRSLAEPVPLGSEPFSYYDLWGFNARQRPLYNSGVVAFSPRGHSELFRGLYYRWLDGGSGALYEMIPLNLELNQRQLLQELDGRFNRLFGVYHAVWRTEPDQFQRWRDITEGHLDLVGFADHLYQSSFFVHFAGAHGLMQQLLRDQSPLL